PAPADRLHGRHRGRQRPARGHREPQPRGLDAAPRPDAARRRGHAGAVRGGRRQRGRARRAGHDARDGVDDRRRRARLSRRLDPGYRPRTRRDHARARGRERKNRTPTRLRRGAHVSMDELAAAALARFGLSPEATASLCNVSENHTYRVEDPASANGYALRIHRDGYRTARQIESELQWVDALREDGAVDTCVPVRAPDGERVVSVSADGLGTRNVVLFEWLPGAEPDPEGDAVIAGFRML